MSALPPSSPSPAQPAASPASPASVSRRDFVKAAAVATTIVGFPTIIPSSALGDEKTPAPSNRINLGFIGVGKQAKGHLGFLAGRPDTQVVSICELEEARRNLAGGMVAATYKKIGRAGEAALCTDFRELLARKDVDAVVIGTPDHWHTSILVEAAKAKKDIYCEKPLTLTIAEAKVCVEAVRKNNVVMQTGSQQRSESAESGAVYPHLKGVSRFRAAAEYIRNGRLGKIKEVLVKIGTTSKPADLPAETLAPGLDFDFWLGQVPHVFGQPGKAVNYNRVYCQRGEPDKYPFNPGWRDYREFSGGHVTDWGAHHFDITQWALGMDGSGPDIIVPPPAGADHGKGGVKLIYSKTPVGDNIVVTHDTNGNGILFTGEKGTLWVNRGELKSTPESILKEPLSETDLRLESPGSTGSHRLNWIECIRDRKDPVCKVEIGAGSVTMCHLANIGYWHAGELNHKPLKWDPAKWEFPENPAANAWRDRPRREKWALPTA